ncbi:MAG: hypothetical protein ABIL58_24165 [Pseudomonadota bacterium]
MTLLATVDIAGVTICLSGDPDIRVQETGSAMQAFFRHRPSSPPATAAHVHITICREPMPEREAGLVKCFDSRQAWSLWTSTTRNVLQLQPPGVATPLWRLSADHRFIEGRLHCHEDFWQETSSKVVLRNPIHYPLDQILVMLRLARQSGIILHAAGAIVNGRGYLFPGKSGAGKSTLASLLAADARITLLSDDRMIVRRVNDGWMAYGTPWPGDAGIAANIGVPLAGVFFLNKSEDTAATELTPGEALVKLLPVVSIPLFDRTPGDAVLSTCGALSAQVPMSDFMFTPRVDALVHLMRLMGA